MVVLLVSVSLCLCGLIKDCSAAEPLPFRVGIELPSQIPFPAMTEQALKDIGISYIYYYVYNNWDQEPNPVDVNNEMMAVCDRLGVDFSIGCHKYDPPDDCVREAVKRGARFRGVVFDEFEHVRLLAAEEYNSPVTLANYSSFTSLEQAYQETIKGYEKTRKHFESLGAECIATHVWPVMHHISAAAGWTVCPKICKEFYSTVSLAIGMGAAKQYNRPLWADCDMWLWAMVPGHTPEEVKCNLLLAYWLGVDAVYLEGCGYNLWAAGKQGDPFSLVNLGAPDKYQLTSHGEMLRWFCKEYLPAHPRQWTFRDVKPNIAIVRFEDTCHGQRYVSVLDSLYGSSKLHSDADTEAWFQIWNLLTFGKTGRDGLSCYKVPYASYGYKRNAEKKEVESYLTRPLLAEAHKFFVPMNGVVVYDHLVKYELLQGVPLIFLTGKLVSDETMKAIRRCVSEGAICVAWGPLARKHGFKEWESGVLIVAEDKGKFILTDDFGVAKVYLQIMELIGRPDEIKYRFGEREVVLRRVTDNEVSVEVR